MFSPPNGSTSWSHGVKSFSEHQVRRQRCLPRRPRSFLAAIQVPFEYAKTGYRHGPLGMWTDQHLVKQMVALLPLCASPSCLFFDLFVGSGHLGREPQGPVCYDLRRRVRLLRGQRVHQGAAAAHSSLRNLSHSAKHPVLRRHLQPRYCPPLVPDQQRQAARGHHRPSFWCDARKCLSFFS